MTSLTTLETSLWGFDAPTTRRIRLLLMPLTTFLAFSWLVRLVLLGLAWPNLDASPGQALLLVAHALAFDLATASAVLALPALYLALVPERWLVHRVHRHLVHGVHLAWLFGLLWTSAAEVVFWNEFEVRFNFIAVNYLVYTQEVLGNLVESYPMGRIVAGLLTLAVILHRLLRRQLDAAGEGEAVGLSPGRRLALALAALLVPFVALQAVSGDFDRVSGNRYADELSRNGVHAFVSAYFRNQLDYHLFYPTRDPEEVLARLRELSPRPAPDPDPALAMQPRGAPGRRPNVMLVLVESLGAQFLGRFGCKLGLTPHLDELYERSLIFTRMHASGTRTVRGLEAVTLSIPPTPGNSLVRQPGNEDLSSIAWPFRTAGYDVRFVYGGYGYFDNMNHFTSHNGFDVVDRTDLSAEEVHFGNIWGVCDGDLYARAMKEADRSHAADRPFFQLLLTTSNHRPYTYPEEVAIPSGTGREGAVQYTDHALGHFLEEASRHPWFEDTVFVILGDHGAASSGRIDVPVHRYHIPCFFYSPAHLQPRVDSQLCSQMDVATTLLGLVGLPRPLAFQGLDLRRQRAGRALVSTYDTLGLYRDDRLTLLRPLAAPEAWSVENVYLPQAATPVPADVEDTIAFYQGASELRRRGLLARPAGDILLAVAPGR